MRNQLAAMPMKSVCVGRFLLDVPEGATVTYGAATLAGWKVSSNREETDQEFTERVKREEDRMASGKNERGAPSLEMVREVQSSDLFGKIFVYQRRWQDWMEGGKVLVAETVSIDAMARSGNVTFEFRSEYRNPKSVEILEKILLQLTAREQAEIPGEAGFCFKRGFIRDPLPLDWNEFTVVFVGFRNHPDASLALNMTAGIDSGKTLLQRDLENTVKRQYPSHFHSLRRGARILNGIPGEEVLDRVLEENGVVGHGFMWESLGGSEDVNLPSMALEFDTGHGRPGNPVNSTFSDAEALALWDKISSSLRHRPTTDKPTTSHSASGTP